ncbi:O-methylsterigmatocystin oxidoreductase [Leucoagaricus sp. SymC.cos]|nr:O-methylsterigmatocystin oxidoreductase [Leucoagaricus sp. SymC.cos]
MTNRMISRILILMAGSILALWLHQFWMKKRRRNSNILGLGCLPYPPGPKGYPFVGAMFDLPQEKPWLVYDQWLKKYGDMVYFEVMGQPFLILGSLKRTTELFDKRSNKYSDRPRFPMLVEMMGFGFTMGMIPYGQWWRRHRRAFHQHFNSNRVYKYEDVQIRETRTFLRRLVDTPHNFTHHTYHLFAAIIMNISYGISIDESSDPYIYKAQESLIGFSEAGVPGRFLVDSFPIMKYIPDWVPGTGWKKFAEYYRELNKLVVTEPFEDVKRRMVEGTASPSVALSLISELPEEGDPGREEEETVVRDVAAVSYVAGADTTVSTVLSFFLAMCLYPDVQKKAQSELDQVLNGRLPEFNDRPSLPYINAIVKEASRWYLVLPLALPHSTSEDDIYDGYFIPKGTIVIGNAWTILQDPEVYPDPEHFIPERFLKDGQLDPDVQDPIVAFFGFGRRICPAVFDVVPEVREDGKPVVVKPEFGGDLFSRPLPFKARIKPRSKEAVELILNSEVLG